MATSPSAPSIPHLSSCTFRSPCMNTVAIVPLLGGKQAIHTNESFHTLLDALAHYVNSGDMVISNDFTQEPDLNKKHDDLELIIPNANLTRPGDWKYDITPLKSHDWSLGCQRLLLFDGRESIGSPIAQSRLTAFDNFKNNHSESNSSTTYADFIDLYPSRGTSAVIGVLNVRDCTNLEDLLLAEEELQQWADRYAAPLFCDQLNTNIDSPIHPKNFIVKRIFVFDSFLEESLSVDITKMKSMETGEAVPFPPIENMDLHLNVVVNNLAVAIFISLEKRIMLLDAAADNSKAAKKNSKNLPRLSQGTDMPSNEDKPSLSTISNIISKEVSSTSLEFTPEGDANVSNVNDTTGSTIPTDEGVSTNTTNSVASKRQGFGFKKLATVLHRNTGIGSSNKVEIPSEELPYQLLTPLDSTFSNLNAKDVEQILKRNTARRCKHSADLALLVGSPMDAFERYTRAAEGAKAAYDPLWYACSLEGIVTSFISMADTGGHGVDEYLDRTFQYPVEIMTAWSNLSSSTSTDGGDNISHEKSKTTMPNVIWPMIEEVSGILSRHEKLAEIHAEVLLKMAWYVAELEGIHLRCRWGEGFLSEPLGTGDSFLLTDNSRQGKRWEKSSLSKIDLDRLKKNHDLDAVFSASSLTFGRKFTELLHQAVTNAGLSSLSRAYIAARCAHLCLQGIRVPVWNTETDSDSSFINYERFTMTRKAAFFTVIAAEALEECQDKTLHRKVINFWIAASHLYTKDANDLDPRKRYGWSTLRGSVLHALSQQNYCPPVETATQLLLLLLSEISTINSKSLQEEKIFEEVTDNHEEHHQAAYSEDRDNEHIAEPLTTKRNVIKYTLTTTRSPFNVQTNSVALRNMASWIDNDPLLTMLLPSRESMRRIMRTDASNLQSLKEIHDNGKDSFPSFCLGSVIPNMSFQDCASIQRYCISHLSEIRKILPTKCLSGRYESSSLHTQLGFIKPPLKIMQVHIVKSESHLLMDRVRSISFATKNAPTSMTTFFNPYANIKKDDGIGKNLVTLIAGGEQRNIEIKFANCLSVPLIIKSCQLEFSKSSILDIVAPPLSLVIPPKCKSFIVRFPFVVITSRIENIDANTLSSSEQDENALALSSNEFEVIGVRIVCFNRTFSLPFNTNMKDLLNLESQIPDPISKYALLHKRSNQNTSSAVKLEAVPPQPNLLVSFSTSPTPLEDDAVVPVHLSDGEIYTIPSFRLENDFGLTVGGRLERLQILGVGLPGLPEEILFDTDQLAKKLEEERDEFSDSSSENFEELMETDGLPPLKMKCLTDDLSLSIINDKSKSVGEGSIVTFQIAATHDMGQQLANGGNVRIRFRYRGPSSQPGVEIWRKREVRLRVVRVKGPRISSVAFRSDLTKGSAYNDLCRALIIQNRQSEKLPSGGSHNVRRKSSNNINDENSSLKEEKVCHNQLELPNVGAYKGVFVSGDNIVLLMAVANETNSSIILSNRNGTVGTVRVTSGVSVKIPVIIPRIACLDENGQVTDIMSELISSTTLQWTSVLGESDSFNKVVRQGRVRIPSRCLREIMEEHQSLTSRICRPPVAIKLIVGREGPLSPQSVLQNDIVDTLVDVSVEDWVPREIVNNCDITIEFCCAKSNTGSNSKTFIEENSKAYFWCGQLRKTFKLNYKSLTHHARICFLKAGIYNLSSCVKIHGTGEEIWWAPSATTITVKG